MERVTKEPSAAPRPPLLQVAFVLLGIEIAGLAGAALWVLVDRPEGVMGGWGYAITMSAVILMFAGLLFFGGRALWAGMRWGRGPVISWQLLQFVTAVTMSELITPAGSWAVALVSIAVTAGFLSPAALAVTGKTLGDNGTDAPVH